MTSDKLRERLKELEEQHAKALGQVNFLAGAIFMLEELLAEETKEALSERPVPDLDPT